MPQPPAPKGEVPDPTLSLAQVPAASGDDLAVVMSAESGLAVVPLPRKETVTLGRGANCDIVVPDESVSRTHAAIHATGTIQLEDLGSRNGTKVLGRRLEAGEKVPLGIGSVIELGAATLLIQRARPEPSERGIARSSRRLPGGEPKRASARQSTRESAREPGPTVLDPTMRRLYAMLDVIAPSPLPVLLLGETGTGKEVFAEQLHARSPRARRPFLPINCAAIPESLLESELFGHEKGAFTGAAQTKLGRFEAADGGTVFLDEVGELPPPIQAKLLRVLESGEVTRLGSVRSKRVDVRFIAATNRDLEKLVQAGRFRQDLYFRLNGFTVTLPPLRQRKTEIVPLAKFFLGVAAKRAGRAVPALGDDAARALEAHDWPGNVRELRNVTERALAMAAGAKLVTRSHVEIRRAASASPPPTEGVREPATEKERILDALAKTSGNQTEAARLLGVSRRTLINRLVTYGIGRPRKGQKKR